MDAGSMQGDGGEERGSDDYCMSKKKLLMLAID